MKIKLKAKDLISPVDNVSTCTIEERLNTALSLNRSSREPVFVIGEKGELLGLISLKNAFFEKRLPLTTKVKNCLISPPEIDINTPFDVIARNMLSTGLNILPVFDPEKKILGVVTIGALMDRLLKSKKNLEDIVEKIKVEKSDTAKVDTTIDGVYEKLRKTGNPRLLITNDRGVVEAIITIKDVEKVLAARKPSERFSTAMGSGNRMSKQIEYRNEKINTRPALEFSTKNVVVCDVSEGVGVAVKRMLSLKIPSIVLVDKFRKPKGVLTTRSILDAIVKSSSSSDIPIIFHHAPDGPTREYRIKQLREMLQKFSEKVNKRNPVRRIELAIERPKNYVGKVVAYDVRLHVFLWSGDSFIASSDSFVARARHVGLETNVRVACREIIKQIERKKGKEDSLFNR